MTQMRYQANYQANYTPNSQRKKENFFLGVAFEVEKPMNNLFKSFWTVFSSPVELTNKFRTSR